MKKIKDKLVKSVVFPFTACLFLLVYSVYGVSAQGGVVPTGAFLGEYFNGTDFDNLVMTRTDTRIDFNWTSESPGVAVDKDYFSARWRGNFFFEEGKYDFFVKSDDGARVYVNNDLIIDNWEKPTRSEIRYQTQMSEGVHQIKVEYYEKTGNANIKSGWALVGLFDDGKEQAPTPTITPTPTISDENNEGEGNETVKEVESLPETGFPGFTVFFGSLVFSLFGAYLFIRFKLS